MPLVAHSDLPTFAKLREQGQDVLTLDSALRQDIRELHIGLLNMMPDSALRATERQFMRLVGSCNQIAQFFVHTFSIPGLERDEATQEYIDNYYTNFDQIKKSGLDALIITGANVPNTPLDKEAFWSPLEEVMAWAEDNVYSVLCSCLSTHALMKQRHQIERKLLPQKLWGIYSHRIAKEYHPILREINTRFDVPHSRFNEIRAEEMEAAGLKVLASSEIGGAHLAVSPDKFSTFYFQGHPEYDRDSLLREYKREVLKFFSNDRSDYPPYPENYFCEEVESIAHSYKQNLLEAKAAGDPAPEFPMEEMLPHVDNTWRDTGKAIFNNWLGLVYQKIDSGHPHPRFRLNSKLDNN